MINEALQFAKEKHKHQVRKFSQEPYIKHPLNVAKIILEHKESHKIEELISAAILHDTLEDTDTTIIELKQLFGELVTSLVIQLTSSKKEINKTGKKEYLAEKMSNKEKMSNWALVIKLADRLDNLSDISSTPENFKTKYPEETLFIINQIEKTRQLSNTHKKIIKKIKDILNAN